MTKNIFDTTDDSVIEKTREWGDIPEGYWRNLPYEGEYVPELIKKALELERQRLKAEVEKVLDNFKFMDLVEDQATRYFIIDRLRTRLFG